MLAERLNDARKRIADSPVYQLVEGFPDIQRLKTDVFRDRVEYSEQTKQRLAVARKQGLDAINAIQHDLETRAKIADTESGVVIDLFLSYRAVKGWQDMINLVSQMSPPLAQTVMVQEQLGLALNRAEHGDEAEKVLLDLIAKRGPSSETYGILGRVYKDRWEIAAKASEAFLAKGLLKKAINAYLKGFEADWRDAYPGINAVTLMELADPPDPLREQLVPVVTYAVKRRIDSGKPDYWDYATLLELAVLAKDEEGAANALADVLASIREPWEPETTARNLRLINDKREQIGQPISWAKEVEETLLIKARFKYVGK